MAIPDEKTLRTIRDIFELEASSKEAITEENIRKAADYYLNECGEDSDKLFAYIRNLTGVGEQVFDEAPAEAKPGKRTRRVNTEKNTMNRIITDRATQMQETPYYVCAEENSKKGALLAYMTATDECIDIGKSTKVDKDGIGHTTFSLKYAGAGAVKGVMVALPQYALEEVRKVTVHNAEYDACDVNRATQENQPYVLRLMTTGEFAESFLPNEAAGSIREADEIWAPTVTKKHLVASKENIINVYDSIQDVQDKVTVDESIVAGKNAIYVQPAYKKVGGQVTAQLYARIKHTVRNRFQAPGNYIPAKIFETMEIKDTYAPDEVDKLNRLYLKRYERLKYKGGLLINTIDPADTSIVTSIDEESKSKIIVGSRFFTSNANESIMHEKIPHWYNRDSEGNPEMISPIGMGLKLRFGAPKKDGSEQVKIGYKIMAAEQNAEGTAYVPDFSAGGRFGKIGDAMRKYGVTVTPEELIKFFKDASVIRDKASKGSSGSRKGIRMTGKNVFGFGRTETKNALQSALSSIQAK